MPKGEEGLNGEVGIRAEVGRVVVYGLLRLLKKETMFAEIDWVDLFFHLVGGDDSDEGCIENLLMFVGKVFNLSEDEFHGRNECFGIVVSFGG